MTDTPIEDLRLLVMYDDVEKYLNQCLDSIVNQTLKDIEIIKKTPEGASISINKKRLIN